jgi:hypothetical protein
MSIHAWLAFVAELNAELNMSSVYWRTRRPDGDITRRVMLHRKEESRFLADQP